MTPTVMTVFGPVEASALGVTLPHEHILCDLGRVTRDPRHFMIDRPLAVEEVGRFKAAGGGAIVDCTTRQFGRDPLGLGAVARATGVHVIMGCGWYREPFYDRSVYEDRSPASPPPSSARSSRASTARTSGRGSSGRSGLISTTSRRPRSESSGPWRGCRSARG